MNKKLSFAAALLAATVLSGVANAKTLGLLLGSFAGNFDPGTTPPARLRRFVAHRLLAPGRVQAWRDRNRAGPGRELGDFRRRPELHLQAASGREVPDHRLLHADPRPERRRRDLLVRAPVQEGQQVEPVRYLPNLLGIFHRHGHAEIRRRMGEGRRPDGQVHADRAEAPFLANLGMDFASIMSKEYADKLAGDGKMTDCSTRSRSAPVRSSSSTTSRMRSSATRPIRTTGGQGEDRRSGLRDHHLTRRALQKLKAGECHVMPYPNPADIAS